MKKIIIFLTLLSICLPALAASIPTYNVPSTIPLNQKLTIYGKYIDTGVDTNILCSFFLNDAGQDQNQVIVRLSDEYVFSDGSFYSEYSITEPEFRRGVDYNAVTICGTTMATSIFKVEQKEDIAFGITPETIRMEWRWWVDPENSQTVVYTLLGILIIAAILYGTIGSRI